MFDHLELHNEQFLDALRQDLDDVTFIVALWPSPHIARLARTLGLSWPGGPVFEQGGSEFFNNMANFKLFCAAADAPAAIGTVVRSAAEGSIAMTELLDQVPAVVVKKAHGGAGAGNHIITFDHEIDIAHSGGLYYTRLSKESSTIEEFWSERWAWASANSTYPVVVEEFHPGARSIYAEHYCGEEGVELSAVGELHFDARQLARETVPVADEVMLKELVASDAFKLAEQIWSLGYRGPLSIDIVVTRDLRYFFTEINAQYTGSTHLYSEFLNYIARPDRRVTQMSTPPCWGFASTADFFATLDVVGRRYNPDTRTGVLPVTPTIGDGRSRPLVFAVIHEVESDVDETLSDIASRLRH